MDGAFAKVYHVCATYIMYYNMHNICYNVHNICYNSGKSDNVYNLVVQFANLSYRFICHHKQCIVYNISETYRKPVIRLIVSHMEQL